MHNASHFKNSQTFVTKKHKQTLVLFTVSEKKEILIIIIVLNVRQYRFESHKSNNKLHSKYTVVSE